MPEHPAARWDYLAPSPAGGVPPAPTEPPSCAVIIAACDVAQFIGAALQSVVDQTVPAAEIVVCDDGSTDDLDGAVAPFRDSMVLVRQARRGEGSARNAAIAAATSELVVVLDGDDTFHPCRLEAIRWLAVERPDLDIIATELEPFGPFSAGRLRRPIREVFDWRDQRQAILTRNFLPAPAFRRQLWSEVDGYDEQLAYAPDWELYIRMILAGARAGLLTEPLYRYRYWRGQVSHDRERVYLGRLEILRRTLALASLSDSERAMVADEMMNARIELWRTRARRGDPNTRGDAFDLARDHAVPNAVRAKALLSAAAPALVGHVMQACDRRRHRGRGPADEA